MITSYAQRTSRPIRSSTNSGSMNATERTLKILTRRLTSCIVSLTSSWSTSTMMIDWYSSIENHLNLNMLENY